MRPLLSKPAAREALDSMQADVTAWLPFYQEILKAANSKHFDAAFLRNMEKVAELNAHLDATNLRFLQIQNETQAEAVKGAASTMSYSMWITFVMVAMGLAIGAAVLWLVRTISSSLRRLASEPVPRAGSGPGSVGCCSSASRLRSSSATSSAVANRRS